MGYRLTLVQYVLLKQTVMSKYFFNGEELTELTLKKTDKHFADIYQGCIDEVLSGKVKVNDKEKYFKSCKEMKEKHIKGLSRDNLTYLQRAYWIQTGNCIALLP